MNVALTVVCSAGRQEGPAIFKDVSPQGALVESAVVRPAIGDSVTILFQASPDDPPDVLRTNVVRHTPDGFAVQFRVPYSVVCEVITNYQTAVDASHG